MFLQENLVFSTKFLLADTENMSLNAVAGNITDAKSNRVVLINSIIIIL